MAGERSVVWETRGVGSNGGQMVVVSASGLSQNAPMARTWLSIDVELVSGHGRDFWPRPGRTFAAARTHTFWDLATAINVHFARWDLSHLSQFILEDGTRISHTEPWMDPPEGTVELREERLSRLGLSEQFAFEFDFGDSWTHLCTVADQRIDPVEVVGEIPTEPVPYWGWGSFPDQYGRRWMEDTGEGDVPPDPRGSDLPPLLPEWRWMWEMPR